MNKLTIIITIFYLTTFQVVFSNTSNTKSLFQMPNTVIIQTANQTGLTESETYKLLYENSKSTNDKVISITQWTIGIIISIVLAILASQIFFNYRINKQEVDYIKKDLDEKLLAMKTEMIASVDEKSRDSLTSIDKRLSEGEKQLRVNLNEKFLLRNEILKSSMDKDIKQLRAEIEKNSGDIWILKGVESNALSSFVRTAVLQIELKSEVKYILDDIIGLLSKLDELNAYDEERLNELIEKLEPQYDRQKGKIIALYKEKPVYKFNDQFPFTDRYSLGRLGRFGLGFPTKQYVKNKPKEK